MVPACISVIGRYVVLDWYAGSLRIEQMTPKGHDYVCTEIDERSLSLATVLHCTLKNLHGGLGYGGRSIHKFYRTITRSREQGWQLAKNTLVIDFNSKRALCYDGRIPPITKCERALG